MSDTKPELVDDPFRPGEKCRKPDAEVHPSVRFEMAFRRRFQEEADAR